VFIGKAINIALYLSIDGTALTEMMQGIPLAERNLTQVKKCIPQAEVAALLREGARWLICSMDSRSHR
jgi:hypothetical protein